MGQVLARDQLVQQRASWKRDRRKVVFTNGCFDLLHVGHIRYLEAAKALGDILVVGVNSDRSVQALEKGPGRPVTPEAERAELIAGLRCVDAAVIFEEPDPLTLITALVPDVLVKGGDWPLDRIIGREVVERAGGTVTTIPLVPGRSTTSIIDRVRQSLKA